MLRLYQKTSSSMYTKNIWVTTTQKYGKVKGMGIKPLLILSEEKLFTTDQKRSQKKNHERSKSMKIQRNWKKTWKM